AAEGTVAGADGEFRYGVEAAYVNGAFSLQGEFMGSSVSADDNVSYTGWYVMGSYFLTGESRPYDSKRGIFKRVKPAKEFAWGESWGATELAARYGSVNYSDFVGGVTLDDLTVGVNIYHNPVFRTMLNYVYSDMGGDGAEAMHSFMMRWQIGM
ncbi:MAG: porin, partial [Planctomycetota bacterium]|nr:porin [Planctomycetota bacterium]